MATLTTRWLSCTWRRSPASGLVRPHCSTAPRPPGPALPPDRLNSCPLSGQQAGHQPLERCVIPASCETRRFSSMRPHKAACTRGAACARQLPCTSALRKAFSVRARRTQRSASLAAAVRAARPAQPCAPGGSRRASAPRGAQRCRNAARVAAPRCPRSRTRLRHRRPNAAARAQPHAAQRVRGGAGARFFAQYAGRDGRGGGAVRCATGGAEAAPSSAFAAARTRHGCLAPPLTRAPRCRAPHRRPRARCGSRVPPRRAGGRSWSAPPRALGPPVALTA
jgi:hypothetical protein